MITRSVSIDTMECGSVHGNPKACTLSGASKEWKGAFADKVSQIRVRKGQTVFMEDTPVLGIYLVNKGRVKLVSSDRWGNERIIRLAADRHILSNMHCPTGNHLYSAVALEDSTVCFFPSDAWQAALTENNSLAIEVAMFYASELCLSEQRLKAMSLMTVEERVVFALLYLTELFDDGNGLEPQVLSIIRSDIAQIAGTNTQQVSRTLASLKDSGLVEVSRREIRIKSVNGLRTHLKAYLPR
jgi:CRP-like cAMP-binding protein